MTAFSRWLVRRAGLARVSLGGGIAGLAASAFVEFPAAPFLLALAFALAVMAVLLMRRGQAAPGAGRELCSRGRVARPRRMDLSQVAEPPGVSGSQSLALAAIPLLVVLTVGLAGAASGALRAGELRRWPEEFSGRPLSVAVTVVDLTARDDQVFAAIDEGHLTGRKVLLLLPKRTRDRADRPLEITEGRRLRVKARLRAPSRAPADGAFDQRAYLLRKGAAGVLEAREFSLLGRRGGLFGMIDGLRERARQHLSLELDSRFSGLLRGIVLGEQAKLEQADTEAFRSSGTAHILSVSGLHVASLAAVVLIGGAAAQLPRAVVTLCAALLAALFVPLTGASPPVLRATLVFLLFLLAESTGRGRDRYQVLLLAAAAILLRNPYAVGDPGFQLSFAAAASMLLFTKRFEAGLDFLPAALRQGLAVSLAATLGTAPVSLFTFGQVSLSGIAANLLVVPLLPPLMALGLGSIASGFMSHSLAALLNQLSSVLLAWLCLVAHTFGRFPLLEQEDLWQALAVLAGIVLALPLSAAILQRPPPFRLGSGIFSELYARVRRRQGLGRRRRLLLALVFPLLVGGFGLVTEKAAGGFIVSTRSWLRARNWPSSVELRVLDVGEGSAALLRTPGGRSVLFDAGPAGEGLGRELRDLGVDCLDLVVLSHPHADHFAGLLEALEDVRVLRVIDQVEGGLESGGPPPAKGSGGVRPQAGSSEEPEAAAYRRLRSALNEQGATWRAARDGLSLEVDGVTIELRAPPQGVTLPAGEEVNDASVVALVRWGTTVILLPGDAEAEVLLAYGFPPVDALVVPHHGSRGAVSRTLLNRLSPNLAIISLARDNSFGHPHAEVLELLRHKGVSTLRTDERGWVALRLGSWGLAAEAEKAAEAETQTENDLRE